MLREGPGREVMAPTKEESEKAATVVEEKRESEQEKGKTPQFRRKRKH